MLYANHLDSDSLEKILPKLLTNVFLFRSSSMPSPLPANFKVNPENDLGFPMAVLSNDLIKCFPPPLMYQSLSNVSHGYKLATKFFQPIK